MSKAIAAEIIIRKYYPDIYKFCCARCRETETAMDITQETFLLFIEKKDELTDKNIRAWLLTVANNKLHDYFRKNTVEKNYVSLDDVEIPIFDDYDLNEDGEVYEFSPDKVQEKILNILNDKEKELFIKLCIEKKSVSLIMEDMNLSEVNFRARKSRLKKKIKNSFSHIKLLIFVLSFKFFTEIL